LLLTIQPLNHTTIFVFKFSNPITFSPELFINKSGHDTEKSATICYYCLHLRQNIKKDKHAESK